METERKREREREDEYDSPAKFVLRPRGIVMLRHSLSLSLSLVKC